MSSKPPNRVDNFEDFDRTTEVTRLDEKKESSGFCWGLCCMQGCVWGVIGGIYFFILVPGGALLIVYGYNNELAVPVILGILLVCVSTCGLPALYLSLKYLRRRRKKRLLQYKAKRNAQKASVTYDNPLGLQEEDVT